MVGVSFANFNMRHCLMFTMHDDKNNNAILRNYLLIKQTACFANY